MLVVGGGNTGFQIAKELSASARRAPRRRLAPDTATAATPGPRPLLVADEVAPPHTTVESRLGQRLRHRDTLIGSSPRELERRFDVELRPRVVDASGRAVRFADGSELEVDAVIWATGYRPDFSWIDLPVFDPDGQPRHRRGVTDFPDLYFLGLTWQHTRGSALLGWVNDDAEFIAERIERANSDVAPQPRVTSETV